MNDDSIAHTIKLFNSYTTFYLIKNKVCLKQLGSS